MSRTHWSDFLAAALSLACFAAQAALRGDLADWFNVVQVGALWALILSRGSRLERHRRALALLVSDPAFGYVSPPGSHRHQCPTCKHVWEHGDDRRGNAEAHMCPACGRLMPRLFGGWLWYEGPLAPTKKGGRR